MSVNKSITFCHLILSQIQHKNGSKEYVITENHIKYNKC